MGQQSIRVAARRAALDAQATMRAARAEHEQRRSALAVTVVQALAERDAAVAACERRAGEALVTLTGAEGLALSEVAEWCGGQVSSREVSRLRRLATTPGEHGNDSNGCGRPPRRDEHGERRR